MKKFRLLALAFSASLLMPMSAALAQQGGMPQVQMVTLQVINNPDGSQCVVTPKGDLAPLPGGGVAGNTAQIYFGSQGGFWYTNKNGQTIDLTQAVQALQARRAQSQQAAQVPQYAPNPYYQQQQPSQQVVVEQQPSSNSSGYNAGTGLATAAAAGMGAMAGAAMSGHYYNMPYGTPYYYGANGNRYYYNNGDREVNDLNENQKTALYNQAKVNQTQEYKQKQVAATKYAQNQNAAAAAASSSGHNDFKQQQDWYQNQLKDNPGKFQQSGNNPFVAANAAGGQGRFGQGAAGADGGGRGGRFAGADGGGGGRFGGAGDRGGFGGGGGRDFGGGGGRDFGGGGRDFGGGGRGGRGRR